MQKLATARAEALFCSGLSTADPVSRAAVDLAIQLAVRTYRITGCAGVVAAEFGDHPETAVPRMRWALGVCNKVYGCNH